MTIDLTTPEARAHIAQSEKEMKGRVQQIGDLARQTAEKLHAEGADVRTVTAAVTDVLQRLYFGKELDHKVRRTVDKVMGTRLQPGEGSGRIAPDGTVSYRR